MGLFDILFGTKKKQAMMEALNKGAKIIDVRTVGEFRSGNVQGSINIPLDKLNASAIKKIKKINGPVIVCCASGARSASAANILRNNGVEVYNGGSWYKVDRLMAS